MSYNKKTISICPLVKYLGVQGRILEGYANPRSQQSLVFCDPAKSILTQDRIHPLSILAYLQFHTSFM